MSSSLPPSDPSQSNARGPLSSDELLPPVEPPSAGFILQLFVVPAVIVLFVVLIWLLMTSLATRDQQNPEQIVETLRSSSQQRWQKASELADMLRLEERYPELKTNTHLAAELAQLLEEEIEAAADDDNAVELRYFLSRVLGEFHVDEGLPVLLKAARRDPERDVRREAINALAVLAAGLADREPPQRLEHPELVPTLVALANEQNDLIRSQTAFALGVITLDDEADPQLTIELEKLVDDLYADARYNAALALARQGSLLAVEPLTEMLDLESLAVSLQGEESPAAQTYKRNMILANALQAIETVREHHPEKELPELRAAIENLLATASSQSGPKRVPDVLLERAEEGLAGWEN